MRNNRVYIDKHDRVITMNRYGEKYTQMQKMIRVHVKLGQDLE